jgi:hypothetical protein
LFKFENNYRQSSIHASINLRENYPMKCLTADQKTVTKNGPVEIVEKV